MQIDSRHRGLVSELWHILVIVLFPTWSYRYFIASHSPGLVLLKVGGPLIMNGKPRKKNQCSYTAKRTKGSFAGWVLDMGMYDGKEMFGTAQATTSTANQ